MKMPFRLVIIIIVCSLAFCQPLGGFSGVPSTFPNGVGLIEQQQIQQIGISPVRLPPPTLGISVKTEIQIAFQTGRTCLLYPCKINIAPTQLAVSQDLRVFVSQKVSQVQIISYQEFQLNDAKFRSEFIFNMKSTSQGPAVNSFQLATRVSVSLNLRRMLDAVNNQYGPIDEGNVQAYDDNHLYIIRGSTFRVIKVLGTEVGQIYSYTFPAGYFPVEVHVSNGYVGLIIRKFATALQPEQVQIDIYRNTGLTLEGVRSYIKTGYFMASREQGSHLLVVSHHSMENVDYTWQISGVGNVDSNIYFGTSADLTNGGIGSASRDVALIPMGPVSNTQWKFAQYLFCDYGSIINLSEDLNLFISSSAYFNGGFRSAIQTLRMYSGGVWGASYWAADDGYIYHPFQLDEYLGKLRVVLLQTGPFLSKSFVRLLELPMIDFNPTSGSTLVNAGLDGFGFLSCRFTLNGLYMVFSGGRILTHIPVMGGSPTTLVVSQFIHSLYPYGANHLVGIGSDSTYNNVAVMVLKKVPFGLSVQNSLQLSSLTHSYTYSTWFTYLALNFDYEHKRIVFPIYTNDNEPFRYGYYLLYADPQNNCLSNLPVAASCNSLTTVIAPTAGKIYKHWDQTFGYSWQTGASQVAYRSVIIDNPNLGNSYLYTGSFCQLQARLIQPTNASPPLFPVPNPGIIEVFDLC